MAKSNPDVKENLALVKRTEQLLAQYPEENYIRLLPSDTIIDNLGNFQEPRAEVLKISPDPEDGDVYIDKRIGEDKRLLKGVSLDRIASAAGISVYPPMCATEKHEKNYVRCRATGVMKKANGEPHMVSKSHAIDIELEEEKAREDYRRWGIWKYDKSKGKNIKSKNFTDAELEAVVRRDILQLRSNMLPLCESKAWNRVVRHIIGIASQYKVEDLEKKEFLVVRFDTTYDMSDPNVLRFLSTRAQTAINNLFDIPDGLDPAKQLETPPVEVTHDAEDLDDLLDQTPESEEPTFTPEQEAVLKREARVRELADGCSLEELKGIMSKKFKGCGYSSTNDPKNYIGQWQVANGINDETKRAKRQAEIIVELEGEEGGENSE